LRESRQELRLPFALHAQSQHLSPRKQVALCIRSRACQYWVLAGQSPFGISSGVSALGSDQAFRGPAGDRGGHQGQLTTRGHLTKSGQTCWIGTKFYRKFWRCSGHPRAIHGRSPTTGRRLEDGYTSNGSSNGSGLRNSTRTGLHDRLFGTRWKEAPLLQPRVQG
jgi:hypothetical protein